jgi:hypothetical protein
VEYTVEQPGPVEVSVLFQDDKFNMTALRGGPYKAAAIEDADPKGNTMSGPVMKEYITK